MGNSIECEPSNSSQDDGNIPEVNAPVVNPDAKAIEDAVRRGKLLREVIIPELEAMQSASARAKVGLLFIR